MNSLLLSLMLFSYTPNLEFSEYRSEYNNSDTFRIKYIENNEVVEIPLTLFRSCFVEDYKVHNDSMKLYKLDKDSTRFHNQRIYYKIQFFSLPKSLVATSEKNLILIKVIPIYGIEATIRYGHEYTREFILEETDSFQSKFRILLFGDIVKVIDCKKIDLLTLVYFDSYSNWNYSVNVNKIRKNKYIKYGQYWDRHYNVIRKKKGKIVVIRIFNYSKQPFFIKLFSLRGKRAKTVYRC